MGKVIYKCAVEGSVGYGYDARGKKVWAICGKIKMDGTCGAHGNFKCKHKHKKHSELERNRETV